MKLLDRYVARQFLGTCGLLLLGLPFLFVVIDVTDNLDRHLEAGVSGAAIGRSYLYQLPQFVFFAFPISALIGTVFTIGNMTRHQEIAAAKAGGISFGRIVAPIVALAALLSVVALGLGELIPVTNRLQLETLGRSEQFTDLRTNFVFQTERGRTLSVRRLDREQGEMTGVVVEQQRGERGAGMHETAERAVWAEEGGWKLENGYLRLFGTDGRESVFRFAGSSIPSLRETPEELLAEPREPEEMRYTEMSRFIRAIERSGGDPRSLRVERAQKIALPLAVFVIVLFAAPLATSSQRGGAAYGIGISLAVTIIYLLLFRVGEAVGSSGAIPPTLAAWMPNLIFLGAGIVLLSRVRT